MFTMPTDWKQDTMNAVPGKFWVRVKVASVTVAATVNQIQSTTCSIASWLTLPSTTQPTTTTRPRTRCSSFKVKIHRAGESLSW